MKEEFMKQREQEEYDNHVIETHYNNLLLLSEEKEVTEEIINQVKEK